jgi:hypothetical protein
LSGRIGPGDLEVVAFWVAEVGRTSGEELRVDGFLGDASAGGTHLLGEPVNVVGAVDHNADGESDASGARLGMGFPSRASFARGNRAKTMPPSSKATNSPSSMIYGQPSVR